MRPHWLPNFLARQELGHYRLYVEHRCSVDRVELAYEETRSLDSNDAAHGAADSVGTILSALREYANGRPSVVVSWAPSATDDLGGIDFVEEEQHLNMRKLFQSLQSFASEFLFKGDARFLSTPEVVLCVWSNRLNNSN